MENYAVVEEGGQYRMEATGKIIKGARESNSHQKPRVLTMSERHSSEVVPVLLIDENDVTAGHAASIGQVDPEDMYYLMSRGIDKETAERLVIRGFLGTVITEIPVKEVRDEMITVLDSKLEQR